MSAGRDGRIVLVVGLLFVATCELSAHRRDEYLQAARIALAPAQFDVELALTPGIDVADKVIRGIDRDGDGAFSDDEKQAYVAAVGQVVAVDVDGEALHPQVLGATFPDIELLRQGVGSIELELRAPHSRLSGGPHSVTFRNAFAPDISVYMANALVPESASISITTQRRDPLQRRLTIDFEIQPTGPAVPPAWLATAMMGIAGVALWLMRSGSLARRRRSRLVAT